MISDFSKNFMSNVFPFFYSLLYSMKGLVFISYFKIMACLLRLHSNVKKVKLDGVAYRLLGKVDPNELVPGRLGERGHQAGLAHAGRPLQQDGSLELQRP